jgi:putative membrane protein
MMSEPVYRRQHPLYFVVLLVNWLKPMLVPAIVLVIVKGKSPFDWPPAVYYILVAALALTSAGSLLSWQRFSYLRDDQQLIVRSGILFRQLKTIHRNRIHSIQIQQPLIQRLFGIAQVVVETAGGGGKSEAVLHTVTIAEAREIQLLARKELGESEALKVTAIDFSLSIVPLDSEIPKPGVRIHISPATFFLAAVTTSNLQLTMAFVAGLVSFADDILGESIYDSLTHTAARYLNGPFSVLIWTGVALLLSWVLSIGLYVWKYAGFKLEGHGDRITVSYGLLEKRQLTFPVSKVQAAMLVEGLLRRPFGRGELRLLVVHSDKEAAVMLHPFVKVSEVEELLGQLVPHIYPLVPSITPPKKAWFSFVRWKLLISVLASAGLIISFGIVLSWPVLLLIPLTVLWGHAQFCSEAAGMDGNHIALRHRRLAVTTAWMRKRNIQTLTLTATVVQRRKGWRSVKAAVMGGMKGYVFTARLLPIEQAEQIKRWYSQR